MFSFEIIHKCFQDILAEHSRNVFRLEPLTDIHSLPDMANGISRFHSITFPLFLVL